MKRRIAGVLLSIAVLILANPTHSAQFGTGFTYQGQLTQSGLPANGDFDLQYEAYDDSEFGSQIGSTVTLEDVTVKDGLFAVTIDLGDVFNGESRWLEIGVRNGSDTGPFTLLAPRQEIAASPHALRARSAGLADDADLLDGMDSSDFLLQEGGLLSGDLAVTGSLTLGPSTSASPTSAALGMNSNATGFQSLAMGNGTTASGDNSVAMGALTTASQSFSLAMGFSTSAEGFRSVALGNDTNASGNDSLAMGSFTAATGESSVALGRRTTAQAFASFVVGRSNEISGNSTSWVSTDPLFVIGNGESAAMPSNALTVLKNGSTGIGLSDPVEKLEVEGNIVASGTVCDSNGCIATPPQSTAGTVPNMEEFGVGDFDILVNTGFRPHKITLHYYLQGIDGSTFHITQTNGIAVFEGTELKFNNIIGNDDVNEDNAPPLRLTASPNSSLSPRSGSDGPFGKRISLAIASISDTGFAIRRTVEGGNVSKVRAKIAWEADP